MRRIRGSGWSDIIECWSILGLECGWNNLVLLEELIYGSLRGTIGIEVNSN